MGGRSDAGEWCVLVAPGMAIDDLCGVQVLHTITTGVTDVEDEGIHLERRRSEHSVLVTNDLLDIANESSALDRSGPAVVMHHRSIDAIVDVEVVDQQGRSNFRWGIDEPIIVLETIVRLIGGPRVRVDDVPTRGIVDMKRHRILFVVDDIEKNGRTVPVRVRGVENAERPRQRVSVDSIMRIERVCPSKRDTPERAILPLPVHCDTVWSANR